MLDCCLGGTKGCLIAETGRSNLFCIIIFFCYFALKGASLPLGRGQLNAEGSPLESQIILKES